MALCAVPVSTSAHSPSTHRVLVGRDRELVELGGALEEVRAGRGSVLLTTGEPGIGKTRLADELGRKAASSGFRVHWGRAWEAGGAPSYWMFIQVLRSVCRGAERERLASWIGARGAELSGLLPELRTLMPGLSMSSAASQSERFPLFDAIGSFLFAAAEAAPQLLVLDDLHAADPSSLLLLEFLVRGLHSSRLLILGTYRDAEARMAPEVGQALTRIRREALVLPLRRLQREEVRELLALATGQPASAGEVDAILERTEGNPLFVHELLHLPGRALREPEGMRDVVRARLALLSAPVRGLLEVAAVLGREFWSAPLGSVAKLSEQDTRGLLAPALVAGIVEPLEQAGRFRFSHVLLRERLYEDLLESRRAELHGAAADELSRRVGAAPLAELAHHLLHAIPIVAVGRAADVALRAARRALELLAFEDARALLQRTVALLEQASGEESRLFEVTLALGLAHIRSAEVEIGKRTCLRAVHLARSLGQGELVARAVLGFADEYTPGIRDRELIALLEEALERLPPGDGALRARCLAQLAAERQLELDTGRSVALAREAIAIARRLGDPDTLRPTLSIAAIALLIYALPEERHPINQEALRLALAAGDKRRALRAHLLSWNDLLELGDRNGAEAHARAYETLASQLGHMALYWTSWGLRGATALWEGRFDDAEQAFARARELARADQTLGASMAALPVGLACARERYEDAPEIEARVRAAFGALAGTPEPATEPASAGVGSCLGEMLIAQLHARAGDRQRTAAQLELVRAHPLFSRMAEPVWLALLSDAAYLLGEAELARRIYDALRPHAHRFSNLGPLGPFYEPPYSRQLGLLAQTLGQVDQAIAHLSDAEARTAQVGLRSHWARARYELARALLVRGAPGDPDGARTLLAQARALATELDQRALLGMLDACEPSALGLPEPLVAPMSEKQYVLQREADYWLVSQRGCSARLRSSRGLQLLARLVSHPDHEFHVLQLIGSAAGEADRGDAGSLLDGQAIQEYRGRLLELRKDLEQAEELGDRGRAELARAESDFLTAELARAVGLGGRERRASSATERARTTVQKRLRGAIRRIEQELPELGRYFDQAIRTGTFCGYFPGGRRPRPRL
jgi:predicted ATPase